MRSPQFALSTMDTGGDALAKGLVGIPTKYSPPNPAALAQKMFDDFYGTNQAVITDPPVTVSDPTKSAIDKLNDLLGKSIGLNGPAFTSGLGSLKRDIIVAAAGIVVLGIGVYVVTK